MPGPGGGPSRRSHTKSRTGCANCKQRHIKCDENSPQCENCRKHKVKCSYSQINDGMPGNSLKPPKRPRPDDAEDARLGEHRGARFPMSTPSPLQTVGITDYQDVNRQMGMSPFPDHQALPPQMPGHQVMVSQYPGHQVMIPQGPTYQQAAPQFAGPQVSAYQVSPLYAQAPQGMQYPEPPHQPDQEPAQTQWGGMTQAAHHQGHHVAQAPTMVPHMVLDEYRSKFCDDFGGNQSAQPRLMTCDVRSMDYGLGDFQTISGDICSTVNSFEEDSYLPMFSYAAPASLESSFQLQNYAVPATASMETLDVAGSPHGSFSMTPPTPNAMGDEALLTPPPMRATLTDLSPKGEPTLDEELLSSVWDLSTGYYWPKHDDISFERRCMKATPTHPVYLTQECVWDK